MRSKYVSKLDTICVLLKGGLSEKSIREVCDATDEEMQQAKEKLERLKLK